LGNIFHFSAILLSVYFLGPIGVALAFVIYYYTYLLFIYFLVDKFISVSWDFAVKKMAAYSFFVLLITLIVVINISGLLLFLFLFAIFISVIYVNINNFFKLIK